MPDCVFCKIVQGELPSHKVYEDDNVLAFLDIAPVSPGHVLIIPKEHFANMEEIPLEKLEQVIAAVKRIGLAVKEQLGAPGYNLSCNNDPVAGQIIPHLHFHIIPRKEKDGLALWPQREYTKGQAEKIRDKLKINK